MKLGEGKESKFSHLSPPPPLLSPRTFSFSRVAKKTAVLLEMLKNVTRPPGPAYPYDSE